MYHREDHKEVAVEGLVLAGFLTALLRDLPIESTSPSLVCSALPEELGTYLLSRTNHQVDERFYLPLIHHYLYTARNVVLRADSPCRSSL